jgi:hypothetical protein
MCFHRSRCEASSSFAAVYRQSIVFFTLISSISTGIAVAQVAKMQQGTTPKLYTRAQSEASDSVGTEPRSSGDQHSTLPADVSGAYEFDHLNESIEVDVDRNKLSGYISRLGDSETDTNTPLTYFFDHASVQGTMLQFQTRVLHGVWYSFRGTIVRGPGQVRSDEGYYVLHGVLQEHHPQDQQEKSADETILRRTVNFKSLAQ